MIWLSLWFLAAFGFAFVAGHSKISLVMRELLDGLPAVDIGGSRYHADGRVEEIKVHPAIPPLIPYVGPWIAALLECVGCLGWWLGFAAGATGFVPLLTHEGWLIDGLFLAFATSAMNLLLAKYVGIV